MQSSWRKRERERENEPLAQHVHSSSPPDGTGKVLAVFTCPQAHLPLLGRKDRLGEQGQVLAGLQKAGYTWSLLGSVSYTRATDTALLVEGTIQSLFYL